MFSWGWKKMQVPSFIFKTTSNLDYSMNENIGGLSRAKDKEWKKEKNTLKSYKTLPNKTHKKENKQKYGWIDSERRKASVECLHGVSTLSLSGQKREKEQIKQKD